MLMEADSCQRPGKQLDGPREIIALVVSFILELKGLTQGFMVRFSHHKYPRGTQANGTVHEERSTSVGSDGMIETVLLFLYYVVL